MKDLQAPYLDLTINQTRPCEASQLIVETREKNRGLHDLPRIKSCGLLSPQLEVLLVLMQSNALLFHGDQSDPLAVLWEFHFTFDIMWSKEDSEMASFMSKNKTGHLMITYGLTLGGGMDKLLNYLHTKNASQWPLVDQKTDKTVTELVFLIEINESNLHSKL